MRKTLQHRAFRCQRARQVSVRPRGRRPGAGAATPLVRVPFAHHVFGGCPGLPSDKRGAGQNPGCDIAGMAAGGLDVQVRDITKAAK